MKIRIADLQVEAGVVTVHVPLILETVVKAMLIGHQHHVMAVVKVHAFLDARHHV